jgi:alpha-ketoglutarate-dependent 2,4-dichlorophenoxyacetate dioxygenase
MSVSICPLHPVFAGEVSGVDCSKPLSHEEVIAIERGMDRYAVLVFRDQNITDEEQIAFTRHFGKLESYATPGHIRKREDQRLGPGIADFSNLDKDGRIMSPEDRVWFFKLGDRLWHSDSSFRPVPAKYSILPGASSRPGAPIPNSPTCAPPMTRSTSAPRPRSRTSSASTR